MTPTAARPSKRSCRGDDGAVVVEFALVVPFFIVIAMGMLEFGFLFRQETIFSGAVQGAARTGSHLGQNPQADQQALSSLYTEMRTMPHTTITRVIVFKADKDDGTVPDLCLSKAPIASGIGVAATCNVYGLSQVQAAFGPPRGGSFGTCTDNLSGGGWDQYWCPAIRKNDLIQTPDWVGIEVEARYGFVTKLFGDSRLVTDRAVFRVEASLG